MLSGESYARDKCTQEYLLRKCTEFAPLACGLGPDYLEANCTNKMGPDAKGVAIFFKNKCIAEKPKDAAEQRQLCSDLVNKLQEMNFFNPS